MAKIIKTIQKHMKRILLYFKKRKRAKRIKEIREAKLFIKNAERVFKALVFFITNPSKIDND